MVWLIQNDHLDGQLYGTEMNVHSQTELSEINKKNNFQKNRSIIFTISFELENIMIRKFWNVPIYSKS